MNKQEAFSYYASQLEGIRESGVLKAERIITTPQSAHIFADGKDLLNMCANNYLGLADNRDLAEAAKAAYDTYGSVSYTHLDVYKRQTQSCCFSGRRPHRCRCPL